MPLETTARSFLVQQLGVQSPSGVGRFSGASKLIDSYLGKESEIIAGLERLKPMPVDQDALQELEKRARGALARLRQAAPGSAAARSELQSARDALKVIKGDMARLAQGARQFVERVRSINERLVGASRRFVRRPTVVAEAKNATTVALEEAQRLARQGYPAQAWGHLDRATKAIDGLPKAVMDFDSAVAQLKKLLVNVSSLNDGLPASVASDLGRQVGLLEQQITALLLARLGIREIQAGLREANARFEEIKTGIRLMAPGVRPEVLEQELKVILELPDGRARLDRLAGIFDTPGHLASLLKVGFRLRDGVSYSGPPDDGVRELRALHKVMLSVPNRHIAENPSLQAVKLQPAGMIGYLPAQGRIELRSGNLDARHQLGDPREVPDVPAELQASAGSVRFFDFSALHEVGHSVDDKKNAMKQLAGNPSFGGWTGYGDNVEAISLKVASAFGIEGVDAGVIVSYIATGAQPFGQGDKRWDEWTKVMTWADGVRHDKAPWKKGDLCQTGVTDGGFKVGDEVYHEGYAGFWFGYLAAERKKGITGYQFRSPGEWYAELYAAYWSGKLPAAHPAYGLFAADAA